VDEAVAVRCPFSFQVSEGLTATLNGFFLSPPTGHLIYCNLAELTSLRAKLFLGFLCLTPLVVGLYLTFFNKHAMKQLAMWELVKPGTHKGWDRFSQISYLVTGFVFLFIGLKMLPILIGLFH